MHNNENNKPANLEIVVDGVGGANSLTVKPNQAVVNNLDNTTPAFKKIEEITEEERDSALNKEADFTNADEKATTTIEVNPDKIEVSSETPQQLEHRQILNALLFDLQPVDFRERANLMDGEELTQRHYYIISIEVILAKAKEKKWSLALNDGELYLYNGCYWSEIDKALLKNFLGQAAEKIGVDAYTARYFSFRDSLFKQFMATAFLPRPIKKSDEVLINLQNGTFVITPENQLLRDFQREDFMTYQLPFAWQENTHTPLFQAYLNKVLPDITQQQVLAEFLGYIFLSQRSLKLEKSLILYGTGANGKSVFFEIMTAMLGPNNVSNYSLQSLTNETGYQRAKLTNKLLNYASEISPNMDSTIFKQLVSGEPVEARLPYKEPFILEDYAKLVFNTNELPRDTEHNEAFFRRFLIVHFAVTIPEDERDPTLANKIIATELPGVFNWVLDGLKRLLLQKKFTYSEAIETMGKTYRQQSDSVQLFLADENFEKDPNASYRLKQLYDEYKAYCQDYGYKSCSLKTLSERLKNLDYEITRKSFGNVVGIIKVLSKAA
jgi:putative DNA primase/helicase